MLQEKFPLRGKFMKGNFKRHYGQEQHHTGEAKKISYLKITYCNGKEFYQYVTEIILESNIGNIPQGLMDKQLPVLCLLSF